MEAIIERCRGSQTLRIIDKISKDVEKALNYDGPVFLRTYPKNPFPLETKNQYCKVCKKITKQEWVRNMDTEYWRCADCLDRQIKEKGIYIPPFVQDPNNYRNARLLFKKGLRI